MTRTHADVIIIGGGLAGIAAAQRLGEHGCRVALFEARPRLGGRVWTVHEPGLAEPIELGPEWFDSFGTIHRLLAARPDAMAEARGAFHQRTPSGLREMEMGGTEDRSVRRRLARIDGADRSLARALRQESTPEHADAERALIRYVEGFHAADPDRLSLRWFLKTEESQSADASQMRTTVGLDAAIDAFLHELTSQCTVYLDTAVRAVRWRRGRVSVDVSSGTRSATFDADAAVVTLPIAVLAESLDERGGVRFDPVLTAKHPALRRIATGPVTKVIHVFDRAFWRDSEDVADALFVQDPSQPIPTWWTTRPIESPLLVGWAAGPQVQRIGGITGEALRATSLRSLAGAFGVSESEVARHWRGWYHHDWQGDPYSRGAYSWVQVGGADAPAHLAAPLKETLFFAGEATAAGGYNATMDGAVQSGWRAAEELLTALQRG